MKLTHLCYHALNFFFFIDFAVNQSHTLLYYVCALLS